VISQTEQIRAHLIAHNSTVGPFKILDRVKVGSRYDYRVQCFCGAVKVMQKVNLLRAKSCGCLTKSLISKARTRHGQTDSPTWKTWKSMLDRCELRAHKSFKDYGGRGIRVCDSWRTYENFVADMGARPDGMQLDRVDNSKGYEPGNCRWSTPKQNCNNRRSSRYLEFKSERRTVAQWARSSGMSPSTLFKRLEDGWSIEKALTQPVKRQRNNAVAQ
jgi:hypothetical protein